MKTCCTCRSWRRTRRWRSTCWTRASSSTSERTAISSARRIRRAPATTPLITKLSTSIRKPTMKGQFDLPCSVFNTYHCSEVSNSNPLKQWFAIVCVCFVKSKQLSLSILLYSRYVAWGEYPLSFAAVLSQEECYRLILSRGGNHDLQVQTTPTPLSQGVKACFFQFYLSL